MKKVLKDIFVKKDLKKRNAEWMEYAEEVKSQFMSLKQKGISIPVFTV